MPLTPVSHREFEALMAPLGPFGPGRRVVVAVSGGADSMALAVLLRRWGDPVAAVVDHGLRPGSAMEAALTVARLQALGIPARLLTLRLRAGPGLGARARDARYAALLAVCRATGFPDLVLGHHALDQVETVTLRTRAGSGPAGLAGMAAVSWRDDARLLRPLLPVLPGRLRATLLAASVAWVEDPTNLDARTARGALRRRTVPMTPVPPGAGAERRAAEAGVAAELAAHSALHAGGYASVRAPLSASAWSALLWTVSGRPHPPPRPAVARLARDRRGTLHGVCVHAGWVFREPAAVAPAVQATEGAAWDGRFMLRDAVPDGELGSLGREAGALRRRPGPPADVLRALPAIRVDGKLYAVPHLHYPDAETCRSVTLSFRPAHVLAGAAFHPAGWAGTDAGEGGCTRGGATPCHVQEPAAAGGIARNG